jgi:hypothetical protein
VLLLYEKTRQVFTQQLQREYRGLNSPGHR